MGTWKPTKLGLFLCHTVQEFVEKPTNNAYEILCISVPPQHGKSLTITQTFPSWYLAKYKTKKVIEISYSESFAQLFGRRNKEKVNVFGNTIFGVNLSKSTRSETEFELDNGQGRMISRGVMSGITGQGADLMVIDKQLGLSI